VAIVEDRATIRESIALLIEAADGFRCAGSYPSMEEALDRIISEETDAVLVDLVLPGISGVEGIRLLRERCPDASAVVFTVYEDDERVFDALCAGALGCLPKKTPSALLLETLEAVVAGGAAPMPPDAARRALELLDDAPPDEVRLLELLAEGYNHETAAREIGSTPESMGRLARSIYRRLHESFRTR
jgi:DNA-binding NarL/FixJ family response regulator